MRVEIHYRWRVKSPAGRWFNTRHAATEESIRQQYPEATPVEGSRTERLVLDQPAELLAAGAHGPRAHLSVLIWPCTIPGRDGHITLSGRPGDYTIAKEGDDWVVKLNGAVEMYRGPGPVRIEAKR